MMSEHLVNPLFFIAFIIDLIIFAAALVYAQREGYSGLLGKSIIFAGLSAVVFGAHHLLEIFLEDITYGLEIAESVEAVAALLLAYSAYLLYSLVSDK